MTNGSPITAVVWWGYSYAADIFASPSVTDVHRQAAAQGNYMEYSFLVYCSLLFAALETGLP